MSGSLITATLPLLAVNQEFIQTKVFPGLIDYGGAIMFVAIIPVVIAAILYWTTEVVNTVAYSRLREIESKKDGFYAHKGLREDLKKLAPRSMFFRRWTWPFFFAIGASTYFINAVRAILQYPYGIAGGIVFLLCALMLQGLLRKRINKMEDKLEKSKVKRSQE